MRHKRSSKWNVAKQMPPLRHSIPGSEFDVRRSEVAQWLARQPEILLLVFESVKGKEIEYDPDTGTWRGIEHED